MSYHMKNTSDNTMISELVKTHLKTPEQLQREKKLELGLNSFRQYCNFMNPDFFKDTRQYQTVICNTMQSMYEKKLINQKTNKPYDILILNLPPGFGKSYTASMFSTWVLGKNKKNQLITVSYNQTLSIAFAKTVRDTIQDDEIQGDSNYFAVKSFFPDIKIKAGDGAMERWSIEGSYMSYLATSFDGSITGMRGNIGIIDDPIKNAEEAVNDRVKDKHWNFYKNTFGSRMLDGALQIIIQTRWASDDLAGRLLKEFPNRCYELKMEALVENKSLCEDLYSTQDLLQKKSVLDNHIWLANYMQQPIDLKGALYGEFKTYDVIDFDRAEHILAYIDTADEGTDYLCCIMGIVVERYGYITDIYYTDEAMEKTEPETARLLSLNNTKECAIESNNGGRGFARNVESILKKSKNKKCNITWFHQSKNKKTRILVNATNVMEQIIMPENWKKKFPQFYKDISTYQRKGKNAHDDAPDALTGFVELINGEVKLKKKAKILKRNLFGI